MKCCVVSLVKFFFGESKWNSDICFNFGMLRNVNIKVALNKYRLAKFFGGSRLCRVHDFEFHSNFRFAVIGGVRVWRNQMLPVW